MSSSSGGGKPGGGGGASGGLLRAQSLSKSPSIVMQKGQLLKQTHKRGGHHHWGRRWAWLHRVGSVGPLSSDWVVWAQSCLGRVVGPWVPQDAIMGPQTVQAIQTFQTQQQLPVTGMLDSGTISALQAACSGPSAGPPPPVGPPPPPPGLPPAGPPPPPEAPPGAPAAPQESGQGEYGGQQESFNEMEDLIRAADLSAITNDQELDQFLGNLINDIGGSIKGFANSAAGQAVGGILKSVAKQVLPLGGAALGGVVGGPAGAMIGSQLASGAGQAFGLELGEMNQEDREFETNRRFARFARNAVKRTTEADPRLPPVEQAKRAVIAAAKEDAPGLVAPAQAIATGTAEADGVQNKRNLAGQWRRSGKDIIIYDI
jgi:peptidoglycan hydrolase-like protein with peptidoglycan-binding domain